MPERRSRPPSGSHVHDSPHGRSRTRQATDQAGHRVTDPLTDELLIAVVSRLRHVVGNERREQGIDRADHGEGQGGKRDQAKSL